MNLKAFFHIYFHRSFSYGLPSAGMKLTWPCECIKCGAKFTVTRDNNPQWAQFVETEQGRNIGKIQTTGRAMGKATIFDNVREWIGGVAFRVFLWSINSTQDEYIEMILEDARREYQSERDSAWFTK